MAAITQRIKNFLGGVSTQPDPKKLPGQVREAKNVYPDAALGLQKRPGWKFLDELHDGTGTNGLTGTSYSGTALENAHWFYIDRDDDEIYIGCIVGGKTPATDNAIHIWNAKPDASGGHKKCTVTYQSTGGVDPRPYLDNALEKNYDVLSVQDTSIITNKQKTVAARSVLGQQEGRATVVLNAVEYSATYKVTVNGVDCEYKTYNADVFTNNSATDTKLNADTILTGLKSAIDASSAGVLVTKGSSTLELWDSSPITISAKGGTTGKALRAFTDEVDTATDLPSTSSQGRTVKIVNTNSSASTYYAMFKRDTVTGVGDGFWEETIKPHISQGLDKATMPHELVNTAVNAFTFKQIDYTDRLVGDDETNSHPSFVDNKINGAFFNRNRLGFLTGENVSMSQAGEFYNFYHITATASTDSDPVDLACSSIRPVTLHAALPAANGMMLFSQNEQFLMYSESGNLTPKDSLINGLSNYEMDKDIKPVDIGTSIYFISKTEGWSRVFSYTMRGLQAPPLVLDVGKVVNEYIPSSITKVFASPQNSFICLYDESNNTIYFYRFYDTGERQEMQAWFKWVCPGKPQTINISNDKLYAVFLTDTGTTSNNRYMMCSLDVSSTPDEVILINSHGNPLNPFMDFYAPALSVVTEGTGTRINLPYTDVSNLEPQIIIKGTAQAQGIFNNAGRIGNQDPNDPFQSSTIGQQAGTYSLVERKTDSNTNEVYWFIANRDYTSYSSRIVVGYKFAYDVHIPTIYLQQLPDGTQVDYTGYLGINRVVFSSGQTGDFGIKVRSLGISGQSHEHTATGSGPIALTFTPTDVNEVAVKINGVLSFPNTYSINSNNQLVFSSNAPSSGDKVLVYETYYFVSKSAAQADYYTADDVSITNENISTFPINQRNTSVDLRVFSNTPFPISLSSMTWEGQYSPRFIRRA